MNDLLHEAGRLLALHSNSLCIPRETRAVQKCLEEIEAATGKPLPVHDRTRRWPLMKPAPTGEIKHDAF